MGRNPLWVLLSLCFVGVISGVQAADKDADDSLSDPEMRRAVAEAEESNLENAAESSAPDADKTLRWIRSLILSAEASTESGRVELENLLRDPQQLRRFLPSSGSDPVERLSEQQDTLLLSLQMAAAKRDDFLVKVSSMPMALPQEDAVRLLSVRNNYNRENRSADLRRARLDVEQARRRLGVGAPPKRSLSSLEALEALQSEFKEGLAELKRTLVSLSAGDAKASRPLLGVRETLGAHIKSLERDIADLGREIELFRSFLILQNAHAVLTTGRKS